MQQRLLAVVREEKRKEDGRLNPNLLTNRHLAGLCHHDDITERAPILTAPPSHHRDAGFPHGHNEKMSPFPILLIFFFANILLYSRILASFPLLPHFTLLHVFLPPHLHAETEQCGLLREGMEDVLSWEGLFGVLLHPAGLVHRLRIRVMGEGLCFSYYVCLP